MHARTLALMTTSLGHLAQRGVVVVTASDFLTPTGLTDKTIHRALDGLKELGWLEYTNPAMWDRAVAGEAVEAQAFRQYVMTEQCPVAPAADALRYLRMLQIYSRKRWDDARIRYAYGTALTIHGLSEIFQGKDFYAWQSEPSLTPPRVMAGDPNTVDFHRSTRVPRTVLTRDGVDLRVSRRHPDSLGDVQLVPVANSLVPCSEVLRTLHDCWLRPDLAGGEDRVAGAWTSYLEESERDSVVASLARMLKKHQDSRVTMRRAFIGWLATLNPAIGATHRGWKGLGI